MDVSARAGKRLHEWLRPDVVGKQRQRHGEDQGFEDTTSSSNAADCNLGSRLSCYYNFPDASARYCLKSATRPDIEVVGPSEGGESDATIILCHRSTDGWRLDRSDS